jgi:uncharacterized protein (DUF302 family)
LAVDSRGAVSKNNRSQNEDEAMKKTTIQVEHVCVKLSSSFEGFTLNLERLLGRFDPSALAAHRADPTTLRENLAKMAGEENLMIFAIRDHGMLQALHAGPRKAKQYVIGNPLIAAQMNSNDLRAGLYAPLRLYVYEDADGSLIAEYDLPSSLLGQFDNKPVNEVARSLDSKMSRIIEKASAASVVPAEQAKRKT